MKKKTLAQKRKEDWEYYTKCAERALSDAQNTENTEVQRNYAMEVYKRALRAAEVSKLDPIAAYRVFSGINL